MLLVVGGDTEDEVASSDVVGEAPRLECSLGRFDGGEGFFGGCAGSVVDCDTQFGLCDGKRGMGVCRGFSVYPEGNSVGGVRRHGANSDVYDGRTESRVLDTVQARVSLCWVGMCTFSRAIAST